MEKDLIILINGIRIVVINQGYLGRNMPLLRNLENDSFNFYFFSSLRLKNFVTSLRLDRLEVLSIFLMLKVLLFIWVERLLHVPVNFFFWNSCLFSFFGMKAEIISDSRFPVLRSSGFLLRLPTFNPRG